MKNTPVFTLPHRCAGLLPTVLLLVACSDSSVAPPPPAAASDIASDSAATQVAVAPSSQPEPAPDSACAGEAGAEYICGPVNAEDLLRLGQSDWVLVSGMSGELAGDTSINGKLHLVNRVDRSWEPAFPGEAPVLAHDVAQYPDCPGPLDTSNFSVHGLALRAYPGMTDQYRLYITSHGAREAIETFMVDASGDKPKVIWNGCVPMPEPSWNNSLVILEDGGFRATRFMESTNGIERVLAGEITGHVWEWHPGGTVTAIAGTELAGPNGIAMSEDEQMLYVAAYGAQAVVRFDLGTTPPTSTLIPLGITPDNVRWSERGTLLTAGGNAGAGCGAGDCSGGWSVWEIDPASLQARRIAGLPAGAALASASSALQLGNELWVGTYMGDRVAILPLQ